MNGWIAPGVAFLSLCFTSVIAVLMLQMRQVMKSDVVATTKKLEEMALVGEKTHTLVNSNMGAQLKLTATVSRRLALITKDDSDQEAASIAETLLHEHERKQEVVDANQAK
jgi:hypothetical protein